MKRINVIQGKLNTSNSLKSLQYPNFIGSWNIENDNLCNEIIKLFEENKSLQKVGKSTLGEDQTVKKTTDITIKPNDLKNIRFKCLKNYIKELYDCYLDYQNQWPFVENLSENVHVGSFNIQKYSSGDHFSKVHTERDHLPTMHRLFAWMTYLNNVDDGGITNYSHYNIKIKPEKGKTLIWPAEWTHAHSGEIINSGVKYIVTGWIHFPHD
tara:strand:- start:229 stop:861 length:633 start_codon:yes stop_codon:yes gene_type:complete